ncbi:MAG: MFS transporter [Candidatus Bathyarchaeia archaeon]
MHSILGPKHARRQILFLIMVDALFGFAIGLSSPSVAPLVFTVGVTLTFVGQAQTIGGLGATFLRFPSGILMDHLGRKRLILLGGFVTLLGFVSYSLVNGWFLLGAGIVLVSMDNAIRNAATSASLGDAERSDRLGRLFSRDLGTTQTAATIAPLIGAYVVTYLGVSTRTVFSSSAAIILVALLLVWLFYQPPSLGRVGAARAEKWFILPNKRILPILVVATLDSFSWGIATTQFWTLYIFKVMNATQEQLGIAIAISAGVQALSGFALGSRLDRVGRRPFMAFSEWCALGAVLPLLFGWRAEFAYISAIFWGLVTSLWRPALYAYVVDSFGREKFGQTLGMISLVSGVAGATAAVIGGLLWDNVSPKLPFMTVMLLAVITGIVIWFKLEDKTNNST